MNNIFQDNLRIGLWVAAYPTHVPENKISKNFFGVVLG